jgi:ABC-2 type transport system ATP-binding protein
MLVLRGIQKAYGGRPALRDVSFTVAAGQPVLLVGRNGAGKTTLLRIATGFLDPDAGDVAIDGLELGYLPEQAPAPVELVVRDHLRLRAHLKGIAGDAIDVAVDAAVRAAAIEAEVERRIGTLSKGFRQRVGLAEALLGDPPLLVLDEPTSGMDPIQTKELCDRLIEAARNRAVLVSSHAVTDLEPLAARVIVLRDGVVVADGTPSALCKQTKTERLQDAVVGLLGEPSA